MIQQSSPFAVKRGGIDIEHVPIRKAVNSQISYSIGFECWQAGTAAGLDMWKWESGQYPSDFMARCIAWYRQHKRVEAHSQDAANRK